MSANSKPHMASLLYTTGRLLLGGVFIWASWDKILDPAAFARAVANYQIVPASVGNLSALVLPWIELVSGICLVLNRWTRGSALITAALMAVFMSAIGYNIFRGMDVSCGCFTLDEQAPGNMWLYLFRDGVFLAVAIGVLCGSRPGLRPSEPQ